MSNAVDESVLSEWIDNSEQSFPTVGTLITFDVVNSGTDTGTAIYFGKGRPGNGLQIRTSATVTIEHVNNRDLKSPITVTTAGLTLSKKKIRNLKIRTSAADTVLKVVIV